MITIQDLYDKTNNGLDIIFHFYPQAKAVYGQNNKAFKIRESDSTPSAHLREVKGIWKVIDFGDEGRAISGIDICMSEMNLKFNEALHHLANIFGVEGQENNALRQANPNIIRLLGLYSKIWKKQAISTNSNRIYFKVKLFLCFLKWVLKNRSDWTSITKPEKYSLAAYENIDSQ